MNEIMNESFDTVRERERERVSLLKNKNIIDLDIEKTYRLSILY